MRKRRKFRMQILRLRDSETHVAQALRCSPFCRSSRPVFFACAVLVTRYFGGKRAPHRAELGIEIVGQLVSTINRIAEVWARIALDQAYRR